MTVVDEIQNAVSLKLDGAQGIATFESGTRTYVAVASSPDDGVQILDVTDPSAITAAGSITDTDTLELDGASSIATFESGGSTYVAVASSSDDGVQILDVTDPSAITAAGSITDTDTLELDGARGIATFESGGHAYAAVTASDDDGVQILNVTDPSAITAAGSITDTDTLELDGARGIATFESGGSTYVAVASSSDDGVQILDVTDPSAITAAGSITDTDTLELAGARGIATFESDTHAYAAVTAFTDDGVQILNVTDPSAITAAGSITDTDADTLELDGAQGIATFESDTHAYAAVTAFTDDGVQILDVTDPSAITAAGSIPAAGITKFNGAFGIATFESDIHAYAAVTAAISDNVQIIRIDIAAPDTTAPVITVTGPNPVTITVGTAYVDGGATCTDDVDGSIEPTSTGTVDSGFGCRMPGHGNCSSRIMQDESARIIRRDLLLH